METGDSGNGPALSVCLSVRMLTQKGLILVSSFGTRDELEAPWFCRMTRKWVGRVALSECPSTDYRYSY